MEQSIYIGGNLIFMIPIFKVGPSCGKFSNFSAIGFKDFYKKNEFEVFKSAKALTRNF